MEDVVDLTPNEKHDHDGCDAASRTSSSRTQKQCLLIYPPPPAKGGIAINSEDIACLAPDEFLNDVIIDFYLKYLVNTVLNAEEQACTHLFSSFFYKRLTSKPPATRGSAQDAAEGSAEKRHTRVRSWTKNVNIFQKKFVLIPINKNVHWFLAVICFPGLTGPVGMSDCAPLEPDVPAVRPNKSGKMATIVLDSPECLSDRDEAESEDDAISYSSDEDRNADSPSRQTLLLKPHGTESVRSLASSTSRDKPSAEPIKQPCILIFDSLRGASSHGRVVATLRDYLQVEYRLKEGKERAFSRHTMRGACPRVPQQDNFTDCGLYVLQYAESFFKAPLNDYRYPIRSLRNWFPDSVVRKKRSDIRNLLSRLVKESVRVLAVPTPSNQQQEASAGKKGVTSGPRELLVRGVGCTAGPHSQLLLYRPLLSRHATSRERIVPVQLVDRPARDALYRLSVDYQSDEDEVGSPRTPATSRQTLDMLRAKRIDRHHDARASPGPPKKYRSSLTRS